MAFLYLLPVARSDPFTNAIFGRFWSVVVDDSIRQLTDSGVLVFGETSQR